MPSALTSEERMNIFLKACSFQLPDVPTEEMFSIFRNAIGEGDLPADDRALLRMASLTVSYIRTLRETKVGKVELDHREEAILEAALEYLGVDR